MIVNQIQKEISILMFYQKASQKADIYKGTHEAGFRNHSPGLSHTENSKKSGMNGISGTAGSVTGRFGSTTVTDNRLYPVQTFYFVLSDT